MDRDGVSGRADAAGRDATFDAGFDVDFGSDDKGDEGAACPCRASVSVRVSVFEQASAKTSGINKA